MATKKDFYNALGVSENASTEEIKKAYHKLAKKYHPDNKESGDESRFKEINEAYQTLSDNKKRAEYDSYGHVFGDTSGFSGFSSPFGDFRVDEDFNFGDIFSEFFSGGGAGARTARGRDISVDLELSFQESIFGTKRTILLAKTALCEVCKGSGAEPKTELETCKTCNGQGRIREARNSFLGTITSVRECPTCKGRKKIPKEKCKACGGQGVLRRQEEISITIPAGIEDGEVIRLTGLGEAIANGVSGDLYVKVRVKPHPVFRRDGSDLVTDLNIKLSDAVLGGEYTIRTIDNSQLTVKIPPATSFGEILRVRGRGVPVNKNRRGDLLIKLDIKLPHNLSKKSKDLFDELRGEGI